MISFIPKRYITNISTFLSTSLISQICYLLQGLIIVKIVPPSIMGLWISMQLLQTYGNHLHLGITNSVNRQVPFYIGVGDRKKAKMIESNGKTVLILLSTLIVVCTVILYFILTVQKNIRDGILLIVLATVLNINVDFYIGLFKAREQFKFASTVNLLRAILMLSGLFLVYRFSFYGLCWRGLIVSFVPLLICLSFDKWNFKFEFDINIIKELFQIGIPIAVLSYVIVMYSSLDRIIILSFLGRQQLGYYALNIAISGALMVFPSTIGQVFYPQMVKEYGNNNNSKHIFLICMKTSFVGFILTVFAGLSVYCILPWVVNTFFLEYLPGLPATLVAISAYSILGLSAGPNYYLIATVQKKRQMIIIIIATISQVVFGYILAPHGLVGIAWSIVISSVIYVFGLWSVVIKNFSKKTLTT
ncbi:MAG: oligosaccharide flippase family protein [Candidatus Thermoplasmatota archaeon]|nr:oligosaccharide flippase family protein [Candidatus Thermoplasmatota archaeon]